MPAQKTCRWRWQTPVLLVVWALLSTAASDSSSSLLPSESVSPTASPGPSPTPSPTPGPTPQPVNASGVVNFTEPKCVYVWIERIDFNFQTSDPRYPNVTTATLASELGHPHHTISGYCSDKSLTSITCMQIYGQGGEQFNFTMVFRTEPNSVDQLWYMDSFRHQYHNATFSGEIFHYTGVQNSIMASGALSYYCESLGFDGQTLNGSVQSNMTFYNLTVQAFNLKGSRPSKTFTHCGLKNKNNRTINITIGLVVGVTVVVALIAIILTLIIRKLRNRGYDLLEH